MSIDFDFYETPDQSGKKTGKYHVRTVTIKTASTDEIASKIQMASSLTIGDIKAVLSLLSQEIANRLEQSERVHLEGIGYFQVTLKADKDIDPNKTRAQSVWFKSVKFRADQELKNKLKNVHTVRSQMKRHSAKLSDTQIDKKVADYFEENEFLTRKKLELLCGFTPSTASRHIKRLKDEGKIKNMGMLRQPMYKKG